MPQSTVESNHQRRKSNTSRSCFDHKGRRTLKNKIANDSTLSSTRTLARDLHNPNALAETYQSRNPEAANLPQYLNESGSL